MRVSSSILFLFVLGAVAPLHSAQNRLLSLEGGLEGGHVLLPSALFTNLTEATVEGWVRVDTYDTQARFVDFGERRKEMYVALSDYQEEFFSGERSFALKFLVTELGGKRHRLLVPGLVRLNEWFHFAAVSGPEGMRLFFNGRPVAAGEYTGSLAHTGGSAFNFLGRSNQASANRKRRSFDGQLDEIRVWSRARSGVEIRRTMYERLSGREPGLVALWGFDDGTAWDPAGRNAGQLVNGARIEEGPFPSSKDIGHPAVVRGRVFDEDGNPVAGASLRMSQEDVTVRRYGLSYVRTTDCYVAVHPNERPYTLTAELAEQGVWRTNVLLRAGDDLEFDMRLSKAPGLPGATNRVLSLNGQNSYVQFPGNIFQKLQAATVEGWVRWDKFRNTSRFWDFGSYQKEMYVAQHGDSSRLKFLVVDPATGARHRIEMAGALFVDRWTHIAAVTGPGGMRLYLNGRLMGTNAYTGSFSALRDERNYLGNLNYSAQPNANFDGEIDEFRVWFVERTQEQIRETMFRRLTGAEKGLFGLWSFDDGTARDLTPNGNHGVFHGNASCIVEPLPWHTSLYHPTLFVGRVTDATGELLDQTRVRLYERRQRVRSVDTDLGGVYELARYVWSGKVDLLLENGDLGEQRLDFGVQPGERVVWDVSLKNAVSISGSVTALEDSPLSAVFVELVADRALASAGAGATGSGARMRSFLSPVDPQFSRWVLTDADGVFKFVNLRAGRYKVRIHTPDGPVSYEDGRYLEFDGKTRIEDIRFQLRPFKFGTWKTYTHRDGLVDNTVLDLFLDKDGVLWFATLGGVSRFDGLRFENFTTEDGLINNVVYRVMGEPSGAMWFATPMGLSRLEEGKWREFTPKDGFLGTGNIGSDLAVDGQGQVWIGSGSGLVRYEDGKMEPMMLALPNKNITALHVDAQGALWIGTEQGLARYGPDVPGGNPESLTSFVSRSDGLAGERVYCIMEHSSGALWFGTGDGVSVYQGGELTVVADGVNVHDLFEDFDGAIWASLSDGVAKVQNETLVYYRGEDRALESGNVRKILQDKSGQMWFATVGSGVARYDGQSMATFSRRDGLTEDDVRVVHTTADGSIWFAHQPRTGGLGHFDGGEIRYYGKEDGLPGDRVSAIYSDRDATLWVGSTLR